MDVHMIGGQMPLRRTLCTPASCQITRWSLQLHPWLPPRCPIRPAPHTLVIFTGVMRNPNG